jgi:hypothetical protein
VLSCCEAGVALLKMACECRNETTTASYTQEARGYLAYVAALLPTDDAPQDFWQAPEQAAFVQQCLLLYRLRFTLGQLPLAVKVEVRVADAEQHDLYSAKAIQHMPTA